MLPATRKAYVKSLTNSLATSKADSPIYQPYQELQNQQLPASLRTSSLRDDLGRLGTMAWPRLLLNPLRSRLDQTLHMVQASIGSSTPLPTARKTQVQVFGFLFP